MSAPDQRDPREAGAGAERFADEPTAGRASLDDLAAEGQPVMTDAQGAAALDADEEPASSIDADRDASSS